MKKIITFIGVASLLTSCDYAEETNNYNIRFYTDPATKVEYILYDAGYGASITPRLNTDGTLYIRDGE